MVTSFVPDTKVLKILKRKVFKYDSSEADEHFFRQRIADWLRKDIADRGSLTKLAYEMSHERNGGGYTMKYMYHDDRNQKARLDNAFFDWVKLVTHIMEQELRLANK